MRPSTAAPQRQMAWELIPPLPVSWLFLSDPLCPESHRSGAHLPMSRSRVDSWDRAIAAVETCIERAESRLAALPRRCESATLLMPLLSGVATAIVVALVLVLMQPLSVPPVAWFALLTAVVVVVSFASSFGLRRMLASTVAEPVGEQLRELLVEHRVTLGRLLAGRHELLRGPKAEPTSETAVRWRNSR